MKYCVMCGSAAGDRQSDCPRCGAQAFSGAQPSDATPVSRRDRWEATAPQAWHGLADMLDEGEELLAEVDLDTAPPEDDFARGNSRSPLLVLVVAILVVVLCAMLVGYMLS